jgi:hypothetical protein
MTDNATAGSSMRTQQIRAGVIAFAAVVLAVSALFIANRSPMPAGPPHERTWEELQTAAAEGGYKILTTDSLARRIEEEPQSLLIVDTRQDWEYRTAHIEGAVVFPVETSKWWWLRNTSKLLALIGPDKDRSLVFY